MNVWKYQLAYLPSMVILIIGVRLILVGHLMAGGWIAGAGVLAAFCTDPERLK